MKIPYSAYALTVLLIFVSFSVVSGSGNDKGAPGKSIDSVPSFKVDPFWPKPLPNQWLLGQVAGVAVDSRNHVWIVHRPKSLGEDEYAPTQEPANCEKGGDPNA